MKKILNYKFQIILITIIIIFGVFLHTNKANAVLGNGDTVVVVGDTSPTGINNYLNHTLQHLKDFVLDKAATLLAKQILHQLTISVINWINNGFEGSPSFLTNPGAFFLDAADQVTGAFLATNGPLSALCSPFAIDIRLSLALSKTNLTTERYTCTVGKIIEAQKNGPDVIVNGKVIRSSNSSYNGFLKGDFNQGGWPAFIAVTTEPQNNPYGAFLSAQADLDAKINSRQNVIRADLQLGQGFMSWQSCKDVPGGTYDPENASQVNEVNSIVGNDAGTKVKKNKDGTETVQTCETQTPGSVIANQLHTSLNVPTVELELANDINAIVNTLMTKMITTMIGTGLHSLSSGGNNSYTNQVIKDIDSGQALKTSVEDLKSAINSAIEEIPKYSDPYKQALALMNDTKSKYEKFRSCLVGRQSNMIADGGLTDIDNTLVSDINPAIAAYQKKYDESLADKTKLQAMIAALDKDPNQVQEQSQKFTEYVRNGGTYVVPRIDAADTALLEAKSKSQQLNARLFQYSFVCPGIIQ